jgi:hypothetical protein
VATALLWGTGPAQDGDGILQQGLGYTVYAFVKTVRMEPVRLLICDFHCEFDTKQDTLSMDIELN